MSPPSTISHLKCLSCMRWYACIAGTSVRIQFGAAKVRDLAESDAADGTGDHATILSREKDDLTFNGFINQTDGTCMDCEAVDTLEEEEAISRAI
ncbi:hypothetical protein BLNAU_16913 [Blattamonas nauphoetae]|uniref:Uncharacterized protein n=1 Tax=Blattamonas nauphoetae TaxID=2049346 RepID=A0ABQ9X7V6_9EUKA|nr:hypothetical protein BLNAU_16913 [Blattamonas nauphoetae]